MVYLKIRREFLNYLHLNSKFSLCKNLHLLKLENRLQI